MNPPNCSNCGTPILPGAKFCVQCGQKAAVHRITLPHFFHEGFHAFTHTDKSIFHLLKCLALRPGSTAREYILGKRQAYFNPFTFFLILTGLFVLSNNYFKPPGRGMQPDPRVLERMPTVEARTKYTTTISRVNTANNIFKKHGNVVAMIAVPFISFFTWLFFRKRQFNYAEHLTAIMMFVAFSNLVFTVFIFPLQGLFRSPAAMGMLTMVALLLQLLYIMWSLNGFLQLHSTGERLKSFFVSLTCILLWALFSMIAMAIYIYQGWDFYKFFLRMKG